MNPTGPEYAAAYQEMREQLTALLRGSGIGAAATPVPATPDWTVHDAVAHLTGICADIANGNLVGVGSDPWTAAQVDARRDQGLFEVLDEWNEVAPGVEANVKVLPPDIGALLIGDAACHSLDVRGALGNKDARDAKPVWLALNAYAPAVVQRAADAGLEPLRIEANGEHWGDGTVVVRGDAFELLRAVTGRRSAEQVAALDWSADPTPYLEIFASYPMRAQPLVE